MKKLLLSIILFVPSLATGSSGSPGDTTEYGFDEKYRPAYHFSPPYGWTNDPNGLVWQNGEYHLFYQHNPYGTTWADMHWGHAATRDLVKWEHFPVAIAPGALGAIFSGSAVIDENNTAGFGRDAMVAVYTSAGMLQTQSIAGSLDGGRTFTKYESNPVLVDSLAPSGDFRDPKVIRYEKESKWVMSLATHNTISFYQSNDLKNWEKTGDFGEGIGAHGGVWECPDLFPLSWNGETKWVLLVSLGGGPNGGSATQYFIGTFDGKTFHADDLPYPLWLDHGRDNYAGVTWNNTPGGRRLFIGWMSNWDYANHVPTVNFRNAMTLVRELKLAHNGRNMIVASYPAADMDTLKHESRKFGKFDCKGECRIEPLCADNPGAFVIEMEVEPRKAGNFGFTLMNGRGEKLGVTFEVQNGKLKVDRRTSGIYSFNDASAITAPLEKKDVYRIALYMDRASSELFVNGGEVVSTNLVFPSEPYDTMKFASDSKIRIDNMIVSTIR